MGSEGNKINPLGIEGRAQTTDGSEVFAKVDGASSQAGRRRFDPGRPLHRSPLNSNALEGARELSADGEPAPTPKQHPKSAAKGSVGSDFLALASAFRGLKSWLVPLAARRASRSQRRG